MESERRNASDSATIASEVRVAPHSDQRDQTCSTVAGGSVGACRGESSSRLGIALRDGGGGIGGTIGIEATSSP